MQSNLLQCYWEFVIQLFDLDYGIKSKFFITTEKNPTQVFSMIIIFGEQELFSVMWEKKHKSVIFCDGYYHPLPPSTLFLLFPTNVIFSSLQVIQENLYLIDPHE